jgi:hypothetical protein
VSRGWTESPAQRSALGKDPAALRLAAIIVDDLKIPGKDVAKAAAIAPALKSITWTAVPVNAISSTVVAAGKTISPPQSLRLMAREYLSGEGNEALPVEYRNGFPFPGPIVPRHVRDGDSASMWVLRPAAPRPGCFAAEFDLLAAQLRVNRRDRSLRSELCRDSHVPAWPA